MRIIKSNACVEEGVAWLCLKDARFMRAYSLTGPLPLRLKPDGFSQLLSAIVSQQVSTASAAAIWNRLCAAELTDEAQILASNEEELRACGLSRQKIRYAFNLAEARINYVDLRKADTKTVVNTLTHVSGIGPWTAEIYAMFSLGHADVFAPGDLALQEAARHLFDWPDRPKEKAFRDIAQKWSPWQSVVARLLWAYYRVINQREGIR